MPVLGSILQTGCIPCAPGQFGFLSGREDCTPCQAGSYNEVLGATSCTSCPAGGYCPEAEGGAFSRLVFQPCPSGTWTAQRGNKGNTSCILCPAGKASSLVGAVSNSTCQLCRAGSVSPVAGLGECNPCPAGTFQDAEGATGCKQCEAGHYCPNGASTSLPCSKGYFSNATNLTKQSECTEAQPGYFSQIGSSSQEPCSIGEFSASAQASGCARCSPGYFQDKHGQTACAACKPGFWCTAGQAVSCAEDTYQPLPYTFEQTSCLPCSRNSTTDSLQNCSSIVSCRCVEGFYEHNVTQKWITGQVDCHVCPSGSDCHSVGTTLSNVPIKRGYFRLTKDSVDIRRCPDAAMGCSNKPECKGSNSGCFGSVNQAPKARDTDANANLCRSALTGPFCRLCNSTEDAVYYAAATNKEPARCVACKSTAQDTILVFSGGGVAAAALFPAAVFCWNRYFPEQLRSQFGQAWVTVTPHYKLRIGVGFYQIVTQIPNVYEVEMPPAVTQMLSTFSTGVSIGLNGVGAVLECLNFRGFQSTLTLYIVAPLVLAALVLMLAAARSLSASRARSVPKLLKTAATPLLLVAFVSYPLVATKAFEAFSCYQFSDSRFLKSDVAVECDSSKHDEVKRLAWVAICLYPVGLLVLNAILLFRTRHAIVSKRPTALSKSIAFLHKQYKPEFFWWELIEMLRRFVLVGLMVLMQDTMMQLLIGMLLAAAFLLFQVQAAPYMSMTDNLLAAASSFCLVVVFLSSIAFKYTVLVDVPDIQTIMSSEQRGLYVLNQELLTAITILSVLGALIASAAIFVLQLFAEQERHRREVLASKARRLRYKSNNKEVKAPTIGPDEFHLFLSHVWGTAQDQVRIIKQRLQEMVPNFCVWLDVDDLVEIGALEHYIDACRSILIYCSDGYFHSKNCIRELIATAKKNKPVIALIEPDKSRGLSVQQVHEQILRAADHYMDWGIDDAAPHGQNLIDHVFANEPIEWNRIGHFQDVTMRLIADRLLPAAPNSTFVDNEIVSHQPAPLQPPNGSFHVYCSSFNAGALGLMNEVAQEQRFRALEGVASAKQNTSSSFPLSSAGVTAPKGTLHIATDKASLALCDHMLLYLTAQTWTRGANSDALAGEIEEALGLGIHILLAHEMPGIGGQEHRHGCEFGAFFACPDGATPRELLNRGIYFEIAVPLKGGPWRKASMALLGSALSMTKEDAKDAAAGVDVLNIRGGSKAWLAKKLRASRKISSAIARASRSRSRNSWSTRSSRNSAVATASVAMTSSTTESPNV